MVDPNTRQGKRTPVTLKIKFKSETLEQFIERYAVDVSQGGIFIRTKEPLSVGTQMKFEFQLRDASPLIAGEGTVVWTRENDPSRPAIAPGMGVRFDRLGDGSQGILERILAEKAKQAPQRPAADTAKPPMFTDTPTRVAPAPIQEALLGDDPRQSRHNNDDGHGDSHTPLPKPMPFHSDADEFPDEAFEEATKVRALDELIAQTADGAGGGDPLPPRRGNGRPEVRDARDVRAGRDAAQADAASDRADTLAESVESGQQRRDRQHSTGRIPAAGVRADGSKPPAELYEAPDLPNPPEPAARTSKLLDTSPSPRIEASQPAFLSDAVGRSRPTGDPLRGRRATPPPGSPTVSSMLSDAVAPPHPPVSAQASLAMRAVAAEQTLSARMPSVNSNSNAPLAILALFILAAGGAALWFFFLRPHATERGDASIARPSDSAPLTTGSVGSAGSDDSVAPSPPVPAGSAAVSGTAALAGSASAGSAIAPPRAELVDTVIGSNASDAKVEIKGTDQAGPAPFTARLERGKSYKVRIAARGFAALELDIKGGDDKTIAKLVAKPRMISISSDPSGAVILVDGQATGHTTPSDIELTSAQAAKKTIKVQLRKSGFRTLDRVVDLTKLTEDDSMMALKLDERLSPQSSRSSGASQASPPREPSKPAGETGAVTEPTAVPAAPSPAPSPPTDSPAPAPASTGSAAEPEPEFNKH